MVKSQGLTDNIHSVVKQSLTSLEKVLSTLLVSRKDWFASYKSPIGLAPAQPPPPPELSLDCAHFADAHQLLHKIFSTILLVFDNKYWVVQNKYCRFIATIDYRALGEVIGLDAAEAYEVSEPSNFFVCVCRMHRC